MNIDKLNKKLKQIDPNITASIKDGCVVLNGEVDEYQKSVKAGQLATGFRSLGVLNDIKIKGFSQKMIVPDLVDQKYDGATPDVLVIGGGICGCAALRELSRYKLKAMLVERGNDVGMGQSSRNGGVVHVGLNFSKKSLKLKYCVEGNDMYDQLAEDLHVPFEHKGQVTFANHAWEKIPLFIVSLTGKSKGIGKLKMMSKDELKKIEPSTPEWSSGGLYMGTGGITCPHKMTIAMAENAIENGAEVCLNTAVLDMEVKDGKIVKVMTNRGTIYPKAIINCAGLYSDKIAEMANDRTFTIHPRTGTDMITDKKAGHLVNTSMGKTPFSLSPTQYAALPKKLSAILKAILKNMHSHSKGVGLIHSVDGNMLVGPNADEVMDREDLSTDRKVVENIIKVQQEVCPEFKASDIIAYFTGIRAATYEEDFVVRKGIKTKNIFEAGGIQSPGITAAPAIAKDLVKWSIEYLKDNGNTIEENKDFNPKRQYKPVLSELTLEERDELIRSNPDYGQIVCRCEEISKGEIIDALHSPLPVYTVDGIKRRVRPGMGRCQGGFCMPTVMKIISEESGIPLEDISKGTLSSKIVISKTK